MIGQLWLEFAFSRTGYSGHRVESKANLADGPTRDFFEVLTRLEAVYVEPVLPAWVFDLWGPIRDPALTDG